MNCFTFRETFSTDCQILVLTVSGAALMLHRAKCAIVFAERQEAVGLEGIPMLEGLN